MIKYRLDFARKYLDIDKSLAEAAAKFVDVLHHIYSGINKDKADF